MMCDYCKQEVLTNRVASLDLCADCEKHYDVIRRAVDCLRELNGFEYHLSIIRVKPDRHEVARVDNYPPVFD